jgi:large subunit ribosomal protein L17
MFSIVHSYHPLPASSHFGILTIALQDTLLARPVAIKALREHSEKEAGEAEQQYFRSIKDYKLKAGETVPGAAGSALRRAQGDLGWAPGRKLRWFERRKLGIDRPLTWEQV